MKIQCDNEDQAQAVFDALNHYLAWDATPEQRQHVIAAVIQSYDEVLRFRRSMASEDEGPGSEYRTQ